MILLSFRLQIAVKLISCSEAIFTLNNNIDEYAVFSL